MESSKKRIICIVLAFVAVVITATALTCVFVNRGQTENYKITVHPNNGQTDFVWDVNADIPVITKDGYHIAGYYLDAEMTKSASFASLKSTELTQDINVYVKWEEHVEATDAAVEPTCTEKGLTEGKHCSKCGKILTTQTEISALGHDLETHDRQEATCTEKGCEEYVTCKRDGCTYTTYQEINTLGHDIEHHAAKPATCLEKGWNAYDTCKRNGCGYTTYQEIDALGHDLDHHNAKAATCTEIGWNEYYTCKRDGCAYTTYQEIGALGHEYAETVTPPTCTQKGYTTHTCSRCSDNYVDTYVDALGHTGGTATCTEQAICERCNEKYGDVLGHE